MESVFINLLPQKVLTQATVDVPVPLGFVGSHAAAWDSKLALWGGSGADPRTLVALGEWNYIK